MVGLQAAAQGPRQTDGGIAVGGDGDLAGGVNEVQVPHELAHRRHHFRGQSPAEAPDVCPGGGFRENPLPQVGHRPALDFLIFRFVDIVLNDSCDLVLLIGHNGILPQLPQGHSGEHHLGGDPLLGIFRRQPRQLIPGFFLVGLGKHLL